MIPWFSWKDYGKAGSSGGSSTQVKNVAFPYRFGVFQDSISFDFKKMN